MPPMIDITGQRFGRWIVVARGTDIYPGVPAWLCRCDCGNEKTVRSQHLRTGQSQSCGCWNVDIHRQICVDRNTTHGESGTKAYRTWVGIIQRCNNPKHSAYRKYGAKGTKVCDRWLESFEDFLADMGQPPTLKHTIDRWDCTGHYEPENCWWTTQKFQQNNRNNNRRITYRGQTMTLMQWSEALGIHRRTLANRLDRLGWTIEEAFMLPASRAQQRTKIVPR